MYNTRYQWVIDFLTSTSYCDYLVENPDVIILAVTYVGHNKKMSVFFDITIIFNSKILRNTSVGIIFYCILGNLQNKSIT